MRFDDQPTLTGDTLRLRPFTLDDVPALRAAASDPAIWAGHPANDRYKPDVFAAYADMLLSSGGTLVVEHRPSNAIIGCSRYYPTSDAPGAFGIGFTFLTTAFWGGKTNLEMKTLMLDHAFETLDQMWFHIATTNIRSQKATAKIGARYVATRASEFSGSGGAQTWMCYVLDKEDWQNR